jgi:hypothetical protein
LDLAENRSREKRWKPDAPAENEQHRGPCSMNALMRQLRSWRNREVGVGLFWGVVLALSVSLVVLFFACLADWVWDRYADTPKPLRVLTTFAQVGLAAGLACLFVLRPLFRTPPLDDYAGRAEKAIPEFGHRLVTAIQLNRPDARTQGMSPVLIAEVTREAGEMAANHRLTRLVDYRRFRWALTVLIPVGLVTGLFAVLAPDTFRALLLRQALFDAEIPRSVHLTNVTKPLWPSGDEVVIRFEATGRFHDSTPGSVRVYPDGQPPDQYRLEFEKATADDKGTFVAKLPPSSVPFTFRAWLGDGRTRTPGRVDFAPRPVVSDVQAWTVLPEYLGKNPKGERYERFMPRGEVVALPGSDARVEATFSKPVRTARLVLIERPADGPEHDLPAREMALSADGTTAADRFPVRRGVIAYRIEAEDEHGFATLSPPRRGIQIPPDEPPRVSLLQEVLKDPDPAVDKGPLEDYEVNGIPVPVGDLVMVGYNARSPMGIRAVNIRFRINEEENWRTQVLSRTLAGPNVGPFVPELGLFQKSGLFDDKGRPTQVEFYPFPSAEPDTEVGELEAGGRYNLQTAGLKKQDGSDLVPGDRIEFYVEVFDKNPAPGRPPGRSESRIKTLVTAAQLAEWNRARDQSRDRLRQLEERQRGVFQPSKK